MILHTLSRYLDYLFTLQICYWCLMSSRYVVICFPFLEIQSTYKTALLMSQMKILHNHSFWKVYECLNKITIQPKKMKGLKTHATGYMLKWAEKYSSYSEIYEDDKVCAQDHTGVISLHYVTVSIFWCHFRLFNLVFWFK